MTAAMKTEVSQPVSKPQISRGAPLQKGFLMLLTVALCIVALEGIFYLARVGEADHLKPDAYIGFKPIEGKRITQRKEGFSTFTINSWGMQNDQVPLAKPRGTIRIAVFGDSFVEAMQVPRAENYCSLLEKQLTARLNRPVQVLNFGVSNYSLAQDYLRYKTLAKKFQPDLAIIAYRVSETEKVLPTDSKALAFIRPVFFPDESGKMVYNDAMIKEFARSKEYKRLMATQWLRRYSRIWGVTGQLAGDWTTFWQGGNKRPGSDTTDHTTNNTAGQAAVQSTLASDKSREAFAQCYWYMVDGLLKEFSQAARQDNCQLMLLRTPFKIQGKTTLQNPTETRLLHQSADRLEALFLDLDGEFRAQGMDSKTDEYFLPFGHFSKSMHRRVADRLCEFISHKAGIGKTGDTKISEPKISEPNISEPNISEPQATTF